MADRRLLFPFVRESKSADGTITQDARLVSKDRIPLPATAHQSYPMRGCANDTIIPKLPAKPGARNNCCWIETALHALLSDPFVRHFVIDYGTKINLVGGPDAAFAPPPPHPSFSFREYTRGALYMQILYARYSLADALGQAAFDYQFDTFYAQLRQSVRVVRAPAVASPLPVETVNMMGDTAELVQVMLPCVRLFIAFHWSGSAFQRQFLAYGCVPLVTRTVACPGRADQCDLNGLEAVSYGDFDTQLHQVNMFSSPFMLTVTREGGSHSLEDLLNVPAPTSTVRFGSRWQLFELPRCAGIKNCNSRRIIKYTLATLPWMLYIQTLRATAEQVSADPVANAEDEEFAHDAVGYALRYNPSRLTVGPTADGQYATYELVCRVSFAYRHYKADVRDPVDRTFTNWNFASATPAHVPSDGDTTSALLVWQRTE